MKEEEGGVDPSIPKHCLRLQRQCQEHPGCRQSMRWRMKWGRPGKKCWACRQAWWMCSRTISWGWAATRCWPCERRGDSRGHSSSAAADAQATHRLLLPRLQLCLRPLLLLRVVLAMRRPMRRGATSDSTAAQSQIETCGSSSNNHNTRKRRQRQRQKAWRCLVRGLWGTLRGCRPCWGVTRGRSRVPWTHGECCSGLGLRRRRHWSTPESCSRRLSCRRFRCRPLHHARCRLFVLRETRQIETKKGK
mmetsp:Transcript_32140/g.58795  ORF Transcript_32140/g.58795 Transcript_32140/m.58795 type:complete len:248 (+) Transcript_32140:337-1080(+)